jgi:hypothetical protein
VTDKTLPNFVGKNWGDVSVPNFRVPELLTFTATARELDPRTLVSNHKSTAGKYARSPYIYLEGKDYPDYFLEARKVGELRHDASALAIVNAAERGFAAGGARGMWEGMLAVQKKFYLQGALPAYALAQTYTRLGENQEALKYLREAYDKRDAAIASLNTDRSFDSLRDDSSFRDLLARSSQPQLN